MYLRFMEKAGWTEPQPKTIDVEASRLRGLIPQRDHYAFLACTPHRKHAVSLHIL